MLWESRSTAYKKNCLICKDRNCTYLLQGYRSPLLKFWSRMYVSFFYSYRRLAEHLGARGRVELIKFDSNLPPPSSSFCEAIVSFSSVCNWPFKLTSEDRSADRKKTKQRSSCAGISWFSHNLNDRRGMFDPNPSESVTLPGRTSGAAGTRI